MFVADVVLAIPIIVGMYVAFTVAMIVIVVLFASSCCCQCIVQLAAAAAAVKLLQVAAAAAAAVKLLLSMFPSYYSTPAVNVDVVVLVVYH